ncbi:hypothetical protein PGT21_027588 [Puccinia graminis f. sp. tritici]|uniref:Uncharacterized protein n=1 Tax=Puccinia graminis f. sp. tritici TaxID=56615 RepID=A0A5B0MDS8_PUCGR|nr:hypothetical protein PGT21_027588 [Puccinia graminis f. sp. tritici]
MHISLNDFNTLSIHSRSEDMYTMGRVFRKTPQQTDGFRPERPQLGCEASNGRSGGPGIIWTLQKASKGCLAGETIQRMVYSPVSIGHLIGSVRWTTRKPSIGHFSECPIDGFHPGPAVEKKGSIVEKLFKRWSMVEKRSKNAARGLLILPSDGWFGPTIRVQQYASRIQWMLLAGPRSDGIWYIRLGVQMPSTTPGGVFTTCGVTPPERPASRLWTDHDLRQFAETVHVITTFLPLSSPRLPFKLQEVGFTGVTDQQIHRPEVLDYLQYST